MAAPPAKGAPVRSAAGFFALLTAFFAAVAAALPFCGSRARARRGVHGRRLSLSSALLVDGAFPESCNMPDAIININVHYVDPPTSAALCDLVKTTFLRFPRFATVPTPCPGGGLPVLSPPPVASSPGAQGLSASTDDLLAAAHVHTHSVTSAAAARAAADAIAATPLALPHGPRWELHLILVTQGEHAAAADQVEAAAPFPEERLKPFLVTVPDTDSAPAPAAGSPELRKARNAADGLERAGSIAVLAAAEAAPHIVVIRVCHSIGDGIALINAFSTALINADGSQYALPSFLGARARASKSAASSAAPPSSAAARALTLVQRGAYLAWDVVSSAVRVALLPEIGCDGTSPFAPHCLGGKLATFSGPRIVIRAPPLSLDTVKAIKNAAGNGASVNDVLMAVAAGAIRTYNRVIAAAHPNVAPGSPADGGAATRCLLPIAFPRPAEALADPERALRNDWTFMSAGMPVDKATPRERLEAAVAVTKKLKSSTEAYVAKGLSTLLSSVAPRAHMRKTVGSLFSRHSLVFSNVPGPDVPVRFAGKFVSDVYMVYPNLITQVGILSYRGKVFFDLTIPAELPQPQILSWAIEEEMDVLAREYGVST